MKTSYKIAFIGAGYMSSEHIKVFKDIPGVILSGIYSRTKSKSQDLASQYGIENVCDSISDLYECTQADLVVVSVPELSTNTVCRELFEFSWHSLIEKPVGYNIEDALSIANAAELAGHKGYVAFNRRHYSSTRSLINSMQLDEPCPRMIYIRDQEDMQAAKASGQPNLVVENWMYANSIHLIDYLTFLGRGNISQVLPIVKWCPENPRAVLSKITYDSGDVAIYHATWNSPGPWSISVNSSDKYFELRPIEKIGVQDKGSRSLVFESPSNWDVNFKPGLRQQAQEVINMLKGLPHNLPTLHDGLDSMRLVEAIYKGEQLL